MNRYEDQERIGALEDETRIIELKVQSVRRAVKGLTYVAYAEDRLKNREVPRTVGENQVREHKEIARKFAPSLKAEIKDLGAEANRVFKLWQKEYSECTAFGLVDAVADAEMAYLSAVKRMAKEFGAFVEDFLVEFFPKGV